MGACLRSVAPNCFQRTIGHGLFALRYFFGVSWLLTDVTLTVLPVTKVVGRDKLTILASQTVLRYVESTEYILWMLLGFI